MEISVWFLSGGFALASSFVLTHPIDTFKTRSQSLKFSPGSAYKCVGVSTLGAFCQGGLRLGTYETVKEKLVGLPDISRSAISAICGDFVSSIAKVPREVVVSLSQTSSLSTSQILSHVYKTQGLRGFYRGFWSTTIRDWPFMVILFTSYESLKTKNNSLLYSTLTGGLSGCLAGFLTTPFDVVKTRIMTSSSNMAQVLSHMSSNSSNSMELTRVLFKGAAPRSLWWFLVCSIFFPTYEASKAFLGPRMNVDFKTMDPLYNR